MVRPQRVARTDGPAGHRGIGRPQPDGPAGRSVLTATGRVDAVRPDGDASPAHRPELLATSASSLAELDAAVATCRACPRLVAWREHVALEARRASFRDETYWGRAVPGLGPDDARVLVVGLAPAAHGANRTGRMFTGDRSGDVLFAALHRAGFASQPTSVQAGDGLVLSDLRITAPVHCAPPDNAPLPEERATCSPFLARELELLAPTVRVAMVLGGFGWLALLRTLTELDWTVPRPRPKFGNGATATVTHPAGRSLTLVGSYHVSQQNTFTGRLTPRMLDEVLAQVRKVAGLPVVLPDVASDAAHPR